MKVVFKDLGMKKFTKTVDTPNVIGFEDLLDFLRREATPYMPEKGALEIVPTDGLIEFAANQFVVVHHDINHVPRGMGTIVIFR
jgi:hypothetical protein